MGRHKQGRDLLRRQATGPCAALTLVWQREGGKELDYRIRQYTGDTVPAGEHTPVKSAERALKDYEKGMK